MRFLRWTLQFLGLTFLLTISTVHSYSEPVWCCFQPKSNPRSGLLKDFSNPECCRTMRKNRRNTCSVIGIVAAAHDWDAPDSIIEVYLRSAKKKMAGFLVMIDQNIDNNTFALILGAWAVVSSGRHWGVGYGIYFFALHAYEPRKPNVTFDKVDCIFGACFAYVASTLCSPMCCNNFIFRALYFALQAKIAYACTLKMRK
jgi:hypothetical protein